MAKWWDSSRRAGKFSIETDDREGTVSDLLQAPTDQVYEIFGLKSPWLHNKDWLTSETGQFLLDR